MMWMPPPAWLIAVAIALLAHAAAIVVIFCLRGWKRGLIAIPLGIVALIVSLVAGVVVDLAVYPIDPAPLVGMLGLGVYLSSLIGLRPAAPRTPLRLGQDVSVAASGQNHPGDQAARKHRSPRD